MGTGSDFDFYLHILICQSRNPNQSPIYLQPGFEPSRNFMRERWHMQNAFRKTTPVFSRHMRICIACGILVAAACRPSSASEPDKPGAGRPDPTVQAARKLKIKCPLMVREWHIWWGAPIGVRPHIPTWRHWNGLRRYGKFDPAATIEETLPGLAWRRYLNCVGYPLLGPYDSSQDSIIRWQLQTAKNAGIECLHVHLWPSLWGDGTDFTPIEIFEKILKIAAELHYPVGVHDEIQFRRPKITRAQLVRNCIRRSAKLLQRFSRHPGWYKIDNMPIYYLQNWSRWISAAKMQEWFASTEAQAGPVYWMVEMGPSEDYLKIPQLKAYFGPHNGWFLHTPPFGAKPHPWEALWNKMVAAKALAKKYGKKYGVMLHTRFDHRNDRGKFNPEKPMTIGADDGMYYVRGLEQAALLEPDFIIAAQWNDFEECGFIEPAWDFDGFNGDPYRWCRITAAAVGGVFSPAPLPRRDEVDPFIRHKLFGDSHKGDMGPVFHKAEIRNGIMQWQWAEGSGEPADMHFVQKQLFTWRPDSKTLFGPIRLANFSVIDNGAILGKNKAQNLRFYVPGGPCTRQHDSGGTFGPGPKTVWLGLRANCPPGSGIKIRYRSFMENYRVDSRWDRRQFSTRQAAYISMPDGSRFYWLPLYGSQFTGYEGDVILLPDGNKKPCSIRALVLFDPREAGDSVATSWAQTQARLPASLDPTKPFVAIAWDKQGNPGLPRLFAEGKTTPAPTRDPMDLVRP